MPKIRVFWSCDGCRAIGDIDNDEAADILGIVEAIDAAHKETTGEFERACRVRVNDLRVHLGKIQPRKRRKGAK